MGRNVSLTDDDLKHAETAHWTTVPEADELLAKLAHAVRQLRIEVDRLSDAIVAIGEALEDDDLTQAQALCRAAVTTGKVVSVLSFRAALERIATCDRDDAFEPVDIARAALALEEPR